VEPDSRFCDACGTALTTGAPAPSPPDAARKIVTVVFADLAGSTPLQERLDPEPARRLMERYYAAMRTVVEDHGGRVVKLLGDGVMAAFGIPTVAEDDAFRAVQAALAMQEAFAAIDVGSADVGPGFGLRVGVNTGEVVVDTDDDDVVGDPVNVAAHLQDHAPLGAVLISEPTRRLVQGHVTTEPAGDLSLKGRSEPVAAHRVLGLDAAGTGLTSRMVGRADELARLHGAFQRAVDGRRAQLALVLGSPGLGKTKLLEELAQQVGGRATVLAGHCDATGSATFAPLAEALRDMAALDDAVPEDEPDRDRILARIDAIVEGGNPGSPEETFWAVRRLLAGLAQRRPVVLVLDDLHWAEPLLLDLVEHLVEWSRDVPLLVVGAARPELREQRSSLTSAGLISDLVVLEALDAGAATRMAADLLGAEELPAAVAGRVLAASEGNPLFVRELVRMLVDDGVVRDEAGGWVATAELADVEMPPSIHALLAARIDRLRPEQQAVLERAAVIGRQFTRAAVDHLGPDPGLDAHLDALRRTELIEPDDSWSLGEPAIRFHHALIQEAAYRRLLRETRAELHARHADWLVEQGSDDDVTLGWHLEQAHRHLDDLEGEASQARELGIRAATHLAAAGRRALEGDDLAAGANLLGRAVACLPREAPERPALLIERTDALLAVGEVAQAREALALAEVAATTPLSAWHEVLAGQLAAITEPEHLLQVAASVGEAAARLAEAGDQTGEAKAHSVHALALARLGQVGDCEAALDRALAAARQAGDRRLANAVLAGAPVAALWGPSPVTRASGRCLDVVRVLRITAGAPAVEAVALRCQAVLEALRGRVEAARRMLGSAHRTLEDLGLTHRLLETEVFAGLVDLLDGDAAAAERRLRGAYEELRSRDLGVDAAQAGSLLARALLRQGRDDEAEALSHEVEALAGHDLKAAIAWRGVRAEAMSRRGDHEAALPLAREAVDIAAATDALLDHADARQSLAAVLRASGDQAGAATEARRAQELYEAKGATGLASDGLQGVAPEADASTSPPAPTNAATQVAAATMAAVAAGDLDEARRLWHPDFRYERRFGLEDSVDAKAQLAVLAELAAGGAVTEVRPVAVLGERLGLVRGRTQLSTYDLGPAEVGPAFHDEFDVVEVDADGRMLRSSGFEAEQLGRAIAELYRWYDPLAAEPVVAWIDALDDPVDEVVELDPDHLVVRASERVQGWRRAEDPFATLAARTCERYDSAWSASDWDAVEALHAEGCNVSDGRNHADFSFREAFASVRTTPDWPTSTCVAEVVATRGEVLLLRRTRYVVDDPPSEITWLEVIEVDRAGLICSVTNLDPDDLEGAVEELDARFLAGEGAPYADMLGVLAAAERASSTRDWAALTRLYTEDFVMRDHRSVGGGVELGREAFVAATRRLLATRSAGDELPRDEWIEQHRPLLSADAAVTVLAWQGELDGGGDFESSRVLVSKRSGQRLRSIDFYDLDQLDQAYARYDELVGTVAPAFTNAATRFVDAWVEAWRTNQWQQGDELFAPEFRSHDRRSLSRLDLSRDEFLRGIQNTAATGVRVEATLLATRGDRLALWQQTIIGTDWDMAVVSLVEVDEHGRALTTWTVDEQDVEAAFEELEARFLTGEGAPCAELLEVIARIRHAVNARDEEAIAACVAPDAPIRMHTQIAGGLSVDRRELVRGLQRGDDVGFNRFIPRHVPRLSSSAAVTVTGSQGEVEGGGTFESTFVIVLSQRGGICRTMDVYDLDQLDRAYARFDELAVPDPFTNRAMRTCEARWEAWRRGDWDAHAAVFADDLIDTDRRAASHLELTKADLLESLREGFDDPDLQLQIRPLASRGESLALFDHWLGAASWELTVLQLVEVGEDGLIRRMATFDREQRDAAFEELDLWFMAGEGAASAEVCRLNTSAMTAMNDRNPEALRRVYAEGFTLHDHDFGFVVDREQVIANVGATDELAALWSITEHVPRVAPDAVVVVMWWGDGTWERPRSESRTVAVVQAAGGRLTRGDLYRIDQVDQAYAHFDELTAPDPFANLATAYNEAWVRSWRDRDWDAFHSLYAPEARMSDRRPLVRTELSLSDYNASAERGFHAPDRTVTAEVLATRGQRSSLVKQSIRSPDWEITALSVTEVGAAGRCLRAVTFDVDDLDAALAELDAIFLAGEAEGCEEIMELNRRVLAAGNSSDRDAFVAHFAANFTFHDHHLGGAIVLDREQFSGFPGLTDDLASHRWSLRHVLRISPGAALTVASWDGELRGGGAFESPWLFVLAQSGGRFTRIDRYGADDLDQALARYDELRPGYFGGSEPA
jgi:class 3 adenylate cyclase/tetratricopeptide (TPR) repeat protein